jgi:hypothetical protein
MTAQSPHSPDTTARITDLKVSRVAAAALAAVTTALLGSMLGAEGTLIGAAAASVVTTVATSVYQTSLERSRERVRSLTHRTRPAHPEADAEQIQPSGTERSRRSATWRWVGVVVGAIVGFALAMLVITGIEWARGETIGDNGKGTTIGQVVNDQSGPQQPAAPPEGPASSEEPTKTSEPPATSTTAPNGSGEQSPTPTTPTSPATPSPSKTTPPPLIPPLPGIGG